jgi:hypothetical protein
MPIDRNANSNEKDARARMQSLHNCWLTETDANGSFGFRPAAVE